MKHVFRILTALAICVLLVLDVWALADKLLGGEELPASISEVIAIDPATLITPDSKGQTESTSIVSDGSPLTMGTYGHELGEYGFGNVMLVPSVTFGSDGSFTISENTGAGMGTISGVYSLSKDGTEVTCQVSQADIACPDTISFTVRNSTAVLLNTQLKKSMAGDTFVLNEG